MQLYIRAAAANELKAIEAEIIRLSITTLIKPSQAPSYWSTLFSGITAAFEEANLAASSPMVAAEATNHANQARLSFLQNAYVIKKKQYIAAPLPMKPKLVAAPSFAEYSDDED